MGRRLLRVAAPVAGLHLLVLAYDVLRHELERTPPHEIATALRGLPTHALVAGACLTLLSYATLTLYDVLALRTVGRRLPYPTVALISFIGYVLSHNLGFAGAVGDAARLRLYGRRGLGASVVARVILFAAFTFWLGFGVLAGQGFLFEPPPLPANVPFPAWGLRAAGAGLLVLVAAYGAFAWPVGGPLRLRGIALEPPGARTAGLQLALSVADWIVSASVLYALLPPLEGVGFRGFLAVFFVAQFGGLLSHVPGGLGVFEGVVVSLLRGAAPSAPLFAALVAWRAIYYLAPLVLAAVLLAADEVYARRRKGAKRPRRQSAEP